MPAITLRRMPGATLLVGLVMGLPVAAHGQDAAAASTVQPATDGVDRSSATPMKIDFARQIKPILVKNCYPCHGPDTSEAGLKFHQQESVYSELISGEQAVIPGDLERSAIIQRIDTDDELMRMPPEGKPLAPEEIELVKQWIAAGAPWERHWSFTPPQRRELPQVDRQDWVRTPIDAFVLHKLEAAGLTPAPPADKVTLLRRAYYDLTGLPPSPAETQAFLDDTSPNAFETLIDRLLDSQAYGERWARHWLDVVRYADTNSFERDGVKPNAWRYRDYVIRALNADKPYDQFIREQLAGDELADATPETIIATGYYRLGLWDDEPADRLLARYDQLDDIVATTSKAFLGLTVDCARCHDHKIDPIPQTDYYSMVAFFQGLGSSGDPRFSQTDITPDDLQDEYTRLEGEEKRIAEAMTELEQQAIAKMSGEDQRRSEGRRRRRLLEEKLHDFLTADQSQTYGQMEDELAALREQKQSLPEREQALSVNNCDPNPPVTHLLQRGNPRLEGDEVAPSFPELFGAPPPEIVPPATGRSSGRRLALANWVASPDNMLTSRVMVNRVWQHHFGRGIVDSPNNFGQIGTPPTHPELLDWLALHFVDSGWRLKPLHKLIMMSSAYQMSSQPSDEALARDADNALFSRFNMRRLTAEEIRDSIHMVTGRLNRAMYGPGIFPDISDEVKAGQSRPGDGWGRSSPEEQARRSVYIHVKRSLITPILASFDFPETDSSCEARFATTQPTQALGMLNGSFVNKQAAQFADRLRSEAGEELRDQVTLALRLTLCRAPDEASIDRGIELIDSLRREHELPEEKALDYYCLVVLNLNEFVYLD
ncbi:MAG: PSD1 and planctomycete cytochrome C domain-containing protein [Pirellulales bacterium]